MSTKILIPQDVYETIVEKVSQLEKEFEKIKKQNQIIPEKDRYMDIKNACMLLGISRASIYRIMNRRELSYTKIGKVRRVLISDLMKLTEAKSQKALISIL